jgi:hypothetical protein
MTPLGQDLTQEALEKDEIFVGWKEVKDLLRGCRKRVVSLKGDP